MQTIQSASTSITSALTGIEFNPALQHAEGGLPRARQGQRTVPAIWIMPASLQRSKILQFSKQRNIACGSDRSGFAGCLSAVQSTLIPNVRSDVAGSIQAQLLQRVSTLRTGIAAYPLVAAVKHLTGRRKATPSC